MYTYKIKQCSPRELPQFFNPKNLISLVLLIITCSSVHAEERANVAASSQGSTVTVSSTGAGGDSTKTIDGNRSGSTGHWADNTGNSWPDTLDVNFGQLRRINEINVFTLQDNYQSPSEPTETMTFSSTGYGNINFEVQYWNGTSWVTITGGKVEGNKKIWRKFTFLPINTTKIRVTVTNAAHPNGVGAYSGITEVEAYSSPRTERTNVALLSHGATASASTCSCTGSPAPYTLNGVIDGGKKVDDYEGGWRSYGSNDFPEWFQVDFSTSEKIDEINVYTAQDDLESPSEPTSTMTFTNNGLKTFDVQYWNGSSWTTVSGGSISNNTNVWKKITFTAVTTSKIRVYITDVAATTGGSKYSWIAEVEAWTPAPGPTDVSGLKLWYKADAITGLNDGDPVSTWTDSSSTGANLTQSTSSRQFTYKVNQVNGKPALYSDGSNRVMSSSPGFSHATYTYFLVSKSLESKTEQWWFKESGNKNIYLKSYYGWQHYYGTDRVLFDANTSPNRVVDDKDKEWHIHELSYDGTNITYTVDGVSMGTTASSSVSSTITSFLLGAETSTGDNSLNGYFAELIAFDQNIGSFERAKIRSYLSSKYSIITPETVLSSSTSAIS